MSADSGAGGSESAVIAVSSPAAALGRTLAARAAGTRLPLRLAISAPCVLMSRRCRRRPLRSHYRCRCSGCVRRASNIARIRLGAEGGNMAIQENVRSDAKSGSQSLIGAATAALALRDPGMPTDFLADSFGLLRPRTSNATVREELAAIADDSWAFLAQRTAGSPKVRLAPAAVTRGVSVLDIVNDDMPFLVDSVVGELHERGLDISLLVHPVFSVERDEAGNLIGFEGARKGDGRRESFIHIHIDGLEDAAAAGRHRSRARRHSRRGARVRAGLAADARARARSDRRSAEQPAAAAGRGHRRSDPVSRMAGRTTISPCSARATMPIRTTSMRCSRHSRPGWGCCARREMRLLRRGNQLVTITPEIREFLEEPRLLIVAKTAVRSRVHRRVHLDYVGVKRFDCRRPAHRRTPVLRPVHLHRLHALDPRHSVSAAQGRQHHPPRRLRSVQPFRQGAGQRPGDLSARRAVPDRRRYALSVRARHSAARRAATRARAAAARPLRPLRLGPRLCPARTLRQPDQGGDRRLSRHHLQRPRCAPSIRSSPKVRWCACTSSSGATKARRRIPIAKPSTARWKRSCAAGSTASMRRSPPRMSPNRGARCSTAIVRPFRSTTAKSIRRRPRSPICGVVEALTPERPLGVDLYRDADEAPANAGLEGLQP